MQQSLPGMPHSLVFLVCTQARKLQDMVLMMAQKGQVQSQITDAYLKQMLEGISDGDDKPSASKITFDRRRFGDDSDSDIDLDGL
jgi:programmed cell death protein 5